MARKNANADAKPKVRRASPKGKPKPKRTEGKRPKDAAVDVEAVSRSSRVRSTSRGGRGR